VGVRRIKVLFVPDGPGAVKQVTISLPVLAFGLFILCCTVAWSCWLIQDYILNSAKMPKLAEIEKESVQKEREFIHLRQRVDELGGKLEGLLALDQKLRSVADLEANQHEIGMLAMGGSELGSAQSGHMEVQASREPHASFHRAAASPEGRIAALLQKSNESPGYPKHHQVSFASMTPIWPVTGFIIYAFGSGVSPGSGETEFHKGIGISTRQGAPVLAPSNGVVTSVGWEQGYGRTLLITHGYGLTTFYGNLGETFVREGQYVENGEKIAVVGERGLYGPYLHYEVRLNGVPVNPLQFISKKPHLS
jgi:murein DD-endopeptidase MepM/ murein hydrolase activator NlpD